MHVAVLGAGYAGLALARRLESTLPAEDDLTLVDERDTHLVQHLVHRVVREPETAADLRRPLADLLDRADHRRARVEAVDPDAGTVELDEGDLSADVLAVCLGATTDFHGLPGVEDHATPLKRIRHAEAIRERFLELCESGGRAVVAGAGLSGIQVAGELAALAAERGAADAVDVRLLEAEPSVAPAFPPPFRRAVDEELRDRGVTVGTGRAVEGADADALALADGDLAYDQFVWTGGIAGSQSLSGSRPRVGARLRLGDRAVGLGDAVRVIDAEGTAVPASAKTALEQVDTAATNVERLVEHRRGEPGGFEPRLATYRYATRGWLVTIGDGAVAQVGPTVLRGRPAKAIKSAVATRYLRSLERDGDVVSALLGALPGAG